MHLFSLSWMSPEGVWVQSSLRGRERRGEEGGGGGGGVTFSYNLGEPKPGRTEAGQCPHTALTSIIVRWVSLTEDWKLSLQQWHDTVPWPLSVLSMVSSMALDTTPTSLPHGNHCFVEGLAFWKGITHSGSLTSRTWCSRRGAPPKFVVCPRILYSEAVATVRWAAPNMFLLGMSKETAAGSALADKFLLDKKLRGSSVFLGWGGWRS